MSARRSTMRSEDEAREGFRVLLGVQGVRRVERRRRAVRRMFSWVVLGLLLLGASLRLPFLTARSLWFDEAFSWRLIQFPPGEFLVRAAADVHPILYYVVLWVWMLPVRGAGPEGTLLWMRLLSVVFAVGTVAAMVAAGRTLFRSRWIGAVAGLLTAVNAFQLQYAWEARMYTLGTLLFPLALAALVSVVEARSRRSARRAGLRLGLTLAAFLHVHYYALFSWVAIGAAKLSAFATRMLKDVKATLRAPAFRWAETGFWLSALPFLPWLPVFLAQASRVEAAFWIPPMNAWSLPNTLARLFWGGTAEIPHAWAVIASVAVAAIILVALIRGRSFGDRALVLSVVVPLLLSALASLRASVYVDRYFLFASLGLLLLIARVLSFAPRNARTLLVLGVAISGVVSVVQFWSSLDIRERPGVRAASAYVRALARDGESVIVSSPFVYLPMSFHLGCGRSGQSCGHNLRVGLFSGGGELPHFAGAPILTATDVVGPEVFSQALRGGRPSRLWVVDTTGFGGSALDVPLPLHRESERRFPELFGYQGDVIVRTYR